MKLKTDRLFVKKKQKKCQSQFLRKAFSGIESFIFKCQPIVEQQWVNKSIPFFGEFLSANIYKNIESESTMKNNVQSYIEYVICILIVQFFKHLLYFSFAFPIKLV